MHSLSDNSFSRLRSLVEIISPAMQEGEMTSFLKQSWQSLVPSAHPYIDAVGNLEFAVIRHDSYPTLAIAAHSDSICVQITRADGTGKYRFRSIGCSPHMLLGQKVLIINEKGEKYDAVIGFDATSQFGQPKGLVFEDLWIDLINPDHQDRVSPGDLVVLVPQLNKDGNYISGTSLDDRLGLFIVDEILRWYASTDMPLNLICIATVQEEVGLRGSLAFDFHHRPDFVLVVDVDYATDIPTPHEDQMGRLYPGKGPGLLRKADNSQLLRNFIKNVASSNNIPLQVSLGRFLYGGTDCTSFQTLRDVKGYHIANITIPLRYMHSPVEIASLSDVSYAIILIKEVMKEMAKTSSSALS